MTLLSGSLSAIWRGDCRASGLISCRPDCSTCNLLTIYHCRWLTSSNGSENVKPKTIYWYHDNNHKHKWLIGRFETLKCLLVVCHIYNSTITSKSFTTLDICCAALCSCVIFNTWSFHVLEQQDKQKISQVCHVSSFNWYLGTQKWLVQY